MTACLPFLDLVPRESFRSMSIAAMPIVSSLSLVRYVPALAVVAGRVHNLWKRTGRLGPIPISLRLWGCLQSFDCVRVSCGDKELQLSLRFESETKRLAPRNKTEAFEVWTFFKQVLCSNSCMTSDSSCTLTNQCRASKFYVATMIDTNT